MLNIDGSRSELVISCQTIISIKNRYSDKNKDVHDTIDNLFTELCPVSGNPGVWLICYHLLRQLSEVYVPDGRSLYESFSKMDRRQTLQVLNKAIKIINWNINQRDKS